MTNPGEPVHQPPGVPGRVEAVTLLAGCGGRDGSGGQAGGTSAPARRTITHSAGSTEVPARAGRVVTLSEALDGHLSSPGLVAVGAVDDVGDWLAPYRPLLDAKLDLSAIPAVGSATEPNYEAIAGLRPELIIGEDFSKDLYPKLAAIAPTVLISRPNNAAWKSAFDQTVTAVGRDEEAESVRERYLKTLGEVSGRAGRPSPGTRCGPPSPPSRPEGSSPCPTPCTTTAPTSPPSSCSPPSAEPCDDASFPQRESTRRPNRAP